MLYAIITFMLGIVIGSGITRRLVRQRWTKRLELSKDEFAYDQQQLTYEIAVQTDEIGAQSDQIQQLHHQLNVCEEECDRLTSEQRSARERADTALQQAKQAYETALTKKESDYQQRISEERTKNIRLQAERSKHRENISASLQTSQEVEKQNTQLSYQNKHLEEKISRLEATISQQQKAHEEDLKSAQSEADLDLAKIVEKLFPTVELLYHSVDELEKHKQDFGSILSEIQTIVTHGHHKRANKLKGTRDSWWECRIGQQRRIYYLETNSEATQYKVVISWKGSKKTQNKVIEWLKKQHY